MLFSIENLRNKDGQEISGVQSRNFDDGRKSEMILTSNRQAQGGSKGLSNSDYRATYSYSRNENT